MYDATVKLAAMLRDAHKILNGGVSATPDNAALDLAYDIVELNGWLTGGIDLPEGWRDIS